MAEINDWDVTDANNNAAPPDGWPENTMNYSEVNDTGRAVQGKIKRFFADINGSLACAGVVNAYTVTLNAGYTAYFDGLFFTASIPITNTAASTLNVNSLGVKSLVDVNGNAFAGGELQAGGMHQFYYDGTDIRVLNVHKVIGYNLNLDVTSTFKELQAVSPIGNVISSMGFESNGDIYAYDNANTRYAWLYDASANELSIPPTITSPTITTPTVNGVPGRGLFLYTTPVVLTNTPPVALNTFYTWNDANLAAAGATAAIVSMRAQIFNNSVTSLLGGVAVKDPGNTTSSILTTVFSSDRAQRSATGQVIVYPMGKTVVPLDAGNDFDYAVYAGTTGGTSISTFELVLHGYYV